MKHLFFVLIVLFTGNCALAQNVGIGTNIPLQKLHVAGNLYVSDSTGIGTPFPLNKLDVKGSMSIGNNYAGAFIAPANGLLVEGNTGIGTATPGYRLDVWHNGATGIRNRSLDSFSTIDIDAFNGDAALRFYKNGDGRWNIRNNPDNDNLDFFETGGGGTRMVIQNFTGYVGINETAPIYQLDVKHFGSTGIRSRSVNSFSVMDIDAFSGDAALRFYKNGTGLWNIRNNPGDDNLEFFELSGGGTRMVIEDSTGNVGIGLNDPDYRLDVLHFGSTGIRNRSATGSSIMDIDAANGDASLRFTRAGTSRWNIRNRSSDNYFEIFKTGTPFPGSILVIKNDSTGNVGIGETINPTYKLDILHAGASGIRNKSLGTYSTIDIDGFTGDAALRFIKNGVNQWNIRNDPNNDNLQFFEMGGGGERMRIENGTGIVRVIGTLAKGAGSFQIDHPLDPENKYLYHSFVESPDMKNIYDGNIVTDASGKAVVELPDYFEALNKDYRYQLTVIGSFAQAIISKKVQGNRFEITTSIPNVEVSWMVTGIRQDAYANKNRIPNSVSKEPENKGRYLHPAAFNQPVTKGIGYPAEGESASPASTTQQATAPKKEEGAKHYNDTPLPAQKNTIDTVNQKQENKIQSTTTDMVPPAPINKTSKTTGKGSTD